MSGSLHGRTLVVTRATDQVGTLTAALAEQGAAVVELPVIAIADPPDGGAALGAAAGDVGSFDWVVVTSPNGARRMVDALSTVGVTVGPGALPRFAAVGPKTAEPLIGAGFTVDLIPDRAVAESLLAAFPAPTPGARVLVARAEEARQVLPEGLAAAGWDVVEVVAYRNVEPDVAPALLERARRADAVTFTAESTVRRYVSMAGGPTPVDAICIGPISAVAACDRGFRVVEADPHSVHGLVAAACAWARS